MWETTNLYWLGFTYGYNLGQCLWSSNINCKQYLDVTAGAGGREAHTEGLILLGTRWQFVNLSKNYSPTIQIFTGLMNISDSERNTKVGVYGAGFGLTTSLHEKLNVKWQNRIGGGDQFWAQTMFSISLNLDSWVETTGSVLKTTIEAPKTFFEWFNSLKEKSK
ncbi:MAG: hypothetical protein A2Z20_04440 [Bdellovibrionales bacterium RBG_16_40_8]|nr:MAG: hypothetical protein A2Z20_04440 [Bdellovibrionales bacterium RBG_16_40_8]